MIENLEVDGRTIAVANLEPEQKALVAVLERLGAEEQELRFSMAKVHALGEVIRKQLTDSLNAPEVVAAE